ncbi:fibroblast growth factor-binding protein 1-like [Symphorus nematophorus]
MLLLRTFAPCLLLFFLGQQVSLSSAARSKSRRGRGGGGADKTVTGAPGRAQRSGNKSAASGRGKFTTNEKMQCSWTAKDVGDTVRLSVKCENPEARVKGGVTDLQCAYNAKPHSCPAYQSNPKGFWKQVARAFRKLHGKVCKDDRALVRTSLCKRAPRDAHFKLDITSSVASAQSGDKGTHQLLPTRSTTISITSTAAAAAPGRSTSCTKRVDHSKKAEEHCSSSWASLCTFFFSMLQSDDC